MFNPCGNDHSSSRFFRKEQTSLPPLREFNSGVFREPSYCKPHSRGQYSSPPKEALQWRRHPLSLCNSGVFREPSYCKPHSRGQYSSPPKEALQWRRHPLSLCNNDVVHSTASDNTLCLPCMAEIRGSYRRS